MDVVAKHGARVAVFRRYRCAGEGDEGGVGQRMAQVLGVADLVAGGRLSHHQGLRIVRTRGGYDSRLKSFQLRFKAVLRAMRFISDYHDVVPVGKHREVVFILAGHELLDGGEDDAARRPVREFGAQVLPGVGLHRLFAQQILRQRKDAKQLAVEVIAVGDDDNRRILHRRFLHHPRREAGHGDALAAALCMPDHPTLLIPTRA